MVQSLPQTYRFAGEPAGRSAMLPVLSRIIRASGVVVVVHSVESSARDTPEDTAINIAEIIITIIFLVIIITSPPDSSAHDRIKYKYLLLIIGCEISYTNIYFHK